MVLSWERNSATHSFSSPSCGPVRGPQQHEPSYWDISPWLNNILSSTPEGHLLTEKARWCENVIVIVNRLVFSTFDTTFKSLWLQYLVNTSDFTTETANAVLMPIVDPFETILDQSCALQLENSTFFYLNRRGHIWFNYFSCRIFHLDISIFPSLFYVLTLLLLLRQMSNFSTHLPNMLDSHLLRMM